MSTGPNRILDEFAKLMTDAAGAAQGVRREVETAFKAQAERSSTRWTWCSARSSRPRARWPLKARDENKKLRRCAERIDALEARLAGSDRGRPSPAASAKRSPKKIIR